jgi:hypothetical protein
MAIYFLSVPWLVLFLSATIVLFYTAALGNIISRIAIAPDRLGIASSLVWNSRNIDSPPGSGTFDSMKFSIF